MLNSQGKLNRLYLLLLCKQYINNKKRKNERE
jgi:hypothetical protein